MNTWSCDCSSPPPPHMLLGISMTKNKNNNWNNNRNKSNKHQWCSPKEHDENAFLQIMYCNFWGPCYSRWSWSVILGPLSQWFQSQLCPVSTSKARMLCRLFSSNNRGEWQCAMRLESWKVDRKGKRGALFLYHSEGHQQKGERGELTHAEKTREGDGREPRTPNWGV